MDMNKGTDINVGSIEEDIKRCEKLIEPQNANWIGITNQLAIAHLIEKVKELRAMCEEYCPKTERIKELEEENRIFKDSNVLVNRYFKLKDNSIPVQKVKDLLTEIQEEYNEVQEQFDCIWNKKSKDDYDRYKLQEFSTMQQQLGFFIGKLEEMLEDK